MISRFQVTAENSENYCDRERELIIVLAIILIGTVMPLFNFIYMYFGRGLSFKVE